MYPSVSDSNLTVGQALVRLRLLHQPDRKALAETIQASYTTYLKLERDQRDLTLLAALRICRFYKLDLHDFISMLSDQELDRNDLSITRVLKQRERKREEAKKAKVIDIKSEQAVPRHQL